MNPSNGAIDRDTLTHMITEKYHGDPEKLIMILQDISESYNYLPGDALELVADTLGIPVSRVYTVATFYKAFSLTPRGKHIINICMGTACHVRGAERIKESLEEKLHIHDGETTEDMNFTMESVRCLGCCALGPVITVNNKAYGKLDRKKAVEVIEKCQHSS